jgi:hypothetical protein
VATTESQTIPTNQLLSGRTLSKYADVFAENEIDSTVLPDLSEADFEKIGIPMGPRKKLLRAISALGDDFEAASMQVGVLDHNTKRL